MFERGTIIAGKYRVERMIGQGGMGVVLAARHLGLDEMVAVKLIREERAEGSDALARFQREARAAARIKSEHVARVLDVDRLPEGQPYIVMELIDGTDLDALVQRRGTLAPDEATTYILQACEGLAEAHALGMVHRDLKLKNLFLTKRRDGRALIKVIDFGVVKFTPIADDPDPTLQVVSDEHAGRRARDATLTGASVLVGSVHYMAPEQIRASNVVDARADVWSLGVCLYAMLTGALPFEGETVGQVCAAIQGRPPRDVRELAPSITADMAKAVMRALEKDARRRYANVAELASALAPFSLDNAAAFRIETILQSSDARAKPHSNAPGSAFGRGPNEDTIGTGPTMASPDPAADARSMIAKARVESTIDGAAAGGSFSSLIPKPRRGMMTGAVVMLVAALATLGIWGRSQWMKASPRADAAPDNPPPAAAAIAEPAPTTTATSAPVATPVVPAPAPVVIAPPPASQQATNVGTARAPTKHGPSSHPPRKGTTTNPPLPPANTSQAPKAEPSSAYDHF